MLNVLFTSYGPIAFGTISLIAIWRVIVKPFLDTNKADIGMINNMIVTMKETAVITQATVTKLDSLIEKMNIKEYRGERNT